MAAVVVAPASVVEVGPEEAVVVDASAVVVAPGLVVVTSSAVVCVHAARRRARMLYRIHMPRNICGSGDYCGTRQSWHICQNLVASRQAVPGRTSWSGGTMRVVVVVVGGRVVDVVAADLAGDDEVAPGAVVVVVVGAGDGSGVAPFFMKTAVTYRYPSLVAVPIPT
jgi:hypothetical protein